MSRAIVSLTGLLKRVKLNDFFPVLDDISQCATVGSKYYPSVAKTTTDRHGRCLPLTLERNELECNT